MIERDERGAADDGQTPSQPTQSMVSPMAAAAHTAPHSGVVDMSTAARAAETEACAVACHRAHAQPGPIAMNAVNAARAAAASAKRLFAAFRFALVRFNRNRLGVVRPATRERVHEPPRGDEERHARRPRHRERAAGSAGASLERRKRKTAHATLPTRTSTRLRETHESRRYCESASTDENAR